MPELDGFEVARTIRDWERIVGGHLPVIALTARSQKEDRERCLAAGMDDYLAKPVRGDDLFAAIDRAVSSTLTPWDTPPAGAGGPNLIDAATLLAGCEGDPEALRGICADLRAYAPERMAAIAEALRAGDAARLRDAAHRHYGLVGAFSPAAGRVASAVEEHADRGDLASAAPLVAELQEMTDRLIREADGLAIDGLRSEVRLPES
jgi:CheY-like chemotaxis protein